MKRLGFRAAGVGGVLALAGCATSAYLGAGDKLRGKNPHAALEYYAKALESSPGEKEILDKIDKVAKAIADKHNSFVQGAKSSKKYDQAVADCDRVIATQNFIDQGSSQVQIYHDREERSRMAKLAAGQQYDRAANLFDQGSFKKAAKGFRRALGFVAGFKDAQGRYEACRSQAVVTVAVAPFRCANHGTPGLANRFRQELHGLVAELNPEFMKIAMDESSAAGGPQQKLTGIVNGGFQSTPWVPRPQQNRGVFSRETGQFDQYGNPVYQQYEVVATWTLYTRKTSASLELNFSIEGADGTGVLSGRKTLRAGDSRQYATQFGGDVNDPNYQSVIPTHIRNLPNTPVEPANFEQLAGQMASTWSKKGGAVYGFAHKIYSKYK